MFSNYVKKKKLLGYLIKVKSINIIKLNVPFCINLQT